MNISWKKIVLRCLPKKKRTVLVCPCNDSVLGVLPSFSGDFLRERCKTKHMAKGGGGGGVGEKEG